jgi:Flp pilus assembly protein TadB
MSEQSPQLEKRTYASILSFVGITRRATAWMRRSKSHSVGRVLLWLLIVLYLLLMYAVILCWYALTICFFFIVIPWRIVRRNHRKQLHLQQAQLAALQNLQPKPPDR